MAELTGSYDPSQVICIVGGVILSGFSDGDAITARRSEDAYSKRVGIDGGVGRARNANKSGEFEFRMLATSSANDQLSSLMAIDNLNSDGLATFPISITDGAGTTLCAATQCWIKTYPEVVFGKDTGERIWVFDSADLKLYIGGNN